MVTRRQRTSRRRRRSQRGAAVFIVVLVITMLTGIGVFAVRSAITATTASGYDRQMTQTHYISDYAVLTTAAELSTERRQAYVRLMTRSPDCITASDCKCKAVRAGSALVTNRTCYIFGFADLEGQLDPGSKLVTPTDVSDPNAPIPGSLGNGQLEANFRVEMTDLAPLHRPLPGHDVSSAGAAQVQFMAVTLNATGQVRPAAIGSDRAAASIESSRAQLIVGPLPKL
jgi:hypothetical protein